MSEELDRQLVAEKERADYAWRNTRAIDAHRMEFEKRTNAEIAKLREALEPFADIRYPDAVPDGAGFASRRNGTHVSYGDIKRAREALATSNAKVRGPEAALSPEAPSRLTG